MLKLIIGNKNYSSWSLRPWLLLSAFKIEFEEVQESLLQNNIQSRLGQYSPTSKVPVLIDEQVTVWDSLAICEYISERYLDDKGWPQDMVKRAKARSLCAEMHAGFPAVRSELPMNCRATRKIEVTGLAKKEIARIDAVWSECVQANGGNCWLFGEFSIVDCFFAPVALRFKTYGISLSETSAQYQKRLLDCPSIKLWLEAANRETEVVPEDEAGVEIDLL